MPSTSRGSWRPRHAALGYGIYQCLGQILAWAELETALPMLFRRFPTLRTTQILDHVLAP